MFSGIPTIQFLIACSMQKMEGGKAGSFNDANDVSVDRQEEKSQIERTHFVHTFFILNQEQCVFFF